MKKTIYLVILLLLLSKNFSFSAQISELERAEEEVRFNNAIRLMELHKYNRTISLLDEYLELYDNGIYRQEALKILGDICFKKFEYQKSIFYYEKLYEEFNDIDEGITGFYRMGLAYSKMGNEKKAIEVFKDIITNYPTSALAGKAKMQLDVLSLLNR